MVRFARAAATGVGASAMIGVGFGAAATMEVESARRMASDLKSMLIAGCCFCCLNEFLGMLLMFGCCWMMLKLRDFFALLYISFYSSSFRFNSFSVSHGLRSPCI